ncbi:MAG: twin-arginine translocation signal domain-containing protein [Syntrophales bacterium]
MARKKKDNIKGITRRDFLKYTAATAAVVGTGSVLTSCGSSDSRTTTATEREKRTYLFNLSHIDTTNCDLSLIAGVKEFPLEKISTQVFSDVTKTHPYLGQVGLQNVTHQVIEMDMPKGRHQTCYIRKINRTTGARTIPYIFSHLPKANTPVLFGKKITAGVMTKKYERYGITVPTSGVTFDDNFKDITDHACQLVSAFPGIRSQETNSHIAIQNYLGSMTQVAALATQINNQGDAWCSYKPLVNPDKTDPNFNKPLVDSSGNQLSMVQWSVKTRKYAGPAISAASNQLQNESAYYSIRTASSQTGKLWDYEEGTTYVNPSGGTGTLQLSSNASITVTRADQFRYHVKDVSMDANRNVTFTINNTGSRYLSAAVAYKDASGNLLTYGQIGASFFKDDPFTTMYGDYSNNQTFFMLSDIINPELRIFAIPIKSDSVKFTVPTPKDAVTVVILAGGLGNDMNQAKQYSPVHVGGTVLTSVLCLAVPTICTAMDAAEAYDGISEDFPKQPGMATLLIHILTDSAMALNFENPEGFYDLAIQVGEWLLTSRCAQFIFWLTPYLGSTEIFNAIPIVGEAAEAIGALADAAELAESIYDVACSPAIYQSNVVATHSISLKVTADPTDTSGFPMGSTNYLVSLLIDNATPVYSGTLPFSRPPSTTFTTPAFNNIPVGGTVSAAISFYGADGCLLGFGMVSMDNSPTGNLTLTIQIKEYLHPLKSDTTYQHYNKVVMDASGNHAYQYPSVAPAATPSSCDLLPGNLCDFGSITINNPAAGVGYSWRGFKSQQQWQFANVSVGFTQNPQSSYAVLDPPSDTKITIAYSLLGTTNYYIDANGHARQIRLQLNGSTSYDSPDSQLSWGQLRLVTNDILLHPEGKIISINQDFNRLEVLPLPAVPWTDDAACKSVLCGGTGSRPGLINTPVACAVTARGELLVLESGNNRVSAFDSSGNPVPLFGNSKYSFTLKDSGGIYLDIAAEHGGFIYVLSTLAGVNRLDVYDPVGKWVFRTENFNAARIAVSLWRAVYSMNYEVQKLPNGTLPVLTEPTISGWIPFGGCSGSSSAQSVAATACSSAPPSFGTRLRDIVGYLSHLKG